MSRTGEGQEERLQVRSYNGEGVVLSRGMNVALFAVAMAWAEASNAVSSRSAQGLSDRLHLGAFESLMEGVFFLFLVVVGFRLLDWIATRGRFAAEVLPLPGRATWPREWADGAAIGWGLCLAAVLPLLLSGNLHARLSWPPGGLPALLVGVLTLLVISLAEETIFRGYPFRRLIQAFGPSWAALVLAVIFGVVLLQVNSPGSPLLALIDGTLFGLVLAMAWLRTHALWLGWGVHFAYRAVMAIVLGLPIIGHGQSGAIADTFATGPRWLSGGAFGLDAAVWTAFVMLAGMIVLYGATKQYAWDYTHRPIVAAGYEVTVAPPAAHVAMEKAAAPPPLVQILPSTPQSRSTVAWPEDRP